MNIIILFNLALLSLGIFVIIKGFIIIFKFLQSIELTNSIEYNMIIIKRFPKDIKSLSINRIFKRNFLIIKSNRTEALGRNLAMVGKKDAPEASKHPIFICESTNNKVLIGNVTSS